MEWSRKDHGRKPVTGTRRDGLMGRMNGLKILGHPLHPAIVHFPVASWTAVVVTDILSLQQVSFWLTQRPLREAAPQGP